MARPGPGKGVICQPGTPREPFPVLEEKKKRKGEGRTERPLSKGIAAAGHQLHLGQCSGVFLVSFGKFASSKAVGNE